MIGWIIGIVLSLALLQTDVVHAQGTENKGLGVAPVRHEMTVKIDRQSVGSIRVANQTAKPMTVDLQVQQFSAVDYTYDFEFFPAKNNWVRFENSRIELAAGEEKDEKFVVKAPRTASPGGHYFALIASADLSNNGLQRKARIVSQLYLLIDGEHVSSGTIDNDTVPFFVYEDRIPFTFDAKNTGNIHYTAFFYGHLEGLLYDQPETGVTHLLLPDTKRKVGGSVAAPFFPGVYTLTYGYRTDIPDDVVKRTATILYIPPWSVIALFFALLTGRWIWQKKTAKHKKTE